MTTVLTREELEASVFQLQPGDLLVLRANRPLDAYTTHKIAEIAQSRVPDGVKVLVVDSSLEVNAYRPPPPE